MCGIDLLLLLSASGSPDQDNDNVVSHAAFISRRGPDAGSTVTQSTPLGPLALTGTVLHLRGPTCVPQPVRLGEDHDGYLCWNGEWYDDTPPDASDTLAVAALVQTALASSAAHGPQHHAMAEALATLVNAEYALVVATPACIYYARDGFGRRSLLSFQSERAFRLASVAVSTDWTEVPPGVVYCYSLETGTITELNISCCCPILPTALAIEPPPPHPHTSAATCPLDCSETMWQASLALEHLLQQAVQRRLCSNHQQHQQQSIGVLFSGGLDSVVLASMVCALRHPVDLYNISFGGNKSRDRLAALASFQELRALYPWTLATLHCIDKTWEDIQAVEDRVRVLLYPKDSVMDINIGCALWFASSASGGGRILLVGMGADEQLGGYTRHRSAAREGTLREEMDMDVNRLWERNLGRDDRLLADHGKEGRFPFLDCHVVQFLKTLPVDDICDFTLPPGQGDKRILRMIAQRHGLVACSGLVKRAIQFGSRISHVSDTQRFGSRRQAKGEKRFDAKKKEKVAGVVIHGDGTVVVRGS